MNQRSVLNRRERARNPQLLIAETVTTHTKKPTAQMAHLVFADTQAKPKKPKEPFFSIARQTN
jgi:hypothetical protein